MTTPLTAILDALWWHRVVENWNTRPTRALLAGLGLVTFVVSDDPRLQLHIVWDTAGLAHFAERGDGRVAEFSASPQSWLDFVEGRFSALVGVVQGRIHFRGAIAAVMPRIAGFDELARVARETAVSADIHQGPISMHDPRRAGSEVQSRLRGE